MYQICKENSMNKAPTENYCKTLIQKRAHGNTQSQTGQAGWLEKPRSWKHTLIWTEQFRYSGVDTANEY